MTPQTLIARLSAATTDAERTAIIAQHDAEAQSKWKLENRHVVGLEHSPTPGYLGYQWLIAISEGVNTRGKVETRRTSIQFRPEQAASCLKVLASLCESLSSMEKVRRVSLLSEEVREQMALDDLSDDDVDFNHKGIVVASTKAGAK